MNRMRFIRSPLCSHRPNNIVQATPASITAHDDTSGERLVGEVSLYRLMITTKSKETDEKYVPEAAITCGQGNLYILNKSVRLFQLAGYYRI
jgi:hypothetical protein